MTSLLEQFLSEARECLESIGARLMQLEGEPENPEVMTELFRLVHTLKGNSGLFEFPEMTRVLHAGEDLMDSVRSGDVTYSLPLADRLLDAMDFVGMLCDEIEANGRIDASHASDSVRLSDMLRQLMVTAKMEIPCGIDDSQTTNPSNTAGDAIAEDSLLTQILRIPESVQMNAFRIAMEGRPLHLVIYTPPEDCFFQGEDPFFQARQTPDLVWGGIRQREPWPKLSELDAYRCLLDFHVLSSASLEELNEYYRYVLDQIQIISVPSTSLIVPEVDPRGGPVCVGLSDATINALETILAAQYTILSFPDDVPWLAGRIKGVAATLSGCLNATGKKDHFSELTVATELAISQGTAAPLLDWLKKTMPAYQEKTYTKDSALRTEDSIPVAAVQDLSQPADPAQMPSASDSEVKFGRRAEDSPQGSKVLKVDQTKIDRLMNLIGEMVVAKNALPYLAGRAEIVFGVRELSREIKAQYAVINRIAEEMQDSIMQVRMMPVSFVFQRFPRLVRDISHRLGKEVHLVLEGEDTEADKNIIESLGDPLMHIVRNSLDHGIEQPDIRRASGKPPAGTLTIRASQESARVIIEIKDDGKGIDPEVIKRKAYENGLIDEERLDRISDHEAIQLVFAAGFSTAEAVSDLSGRGVGMDVVRSAVEKINGTILLESEKNKGTTLRLSLPLSMAVTNVMIVESNNQIFGIPMEIVLETVRVSRKKIHSIKSVETTVLRGRIVPLKGLNALLGLGTLPQPNAEDELAVIVIHHGDEPVGIIVDDFRETVDIILKPMAGVLAGLAAYSGSALLGDGSVLMVLNVKEIL